MEAACANGRIQTVKYLLSTECPYSAYECCTRAALNGQLNLIKWNVTNEPFSSNMHTHYNEMMFDATRSGSIEVVMWLRAEQHVQLDVGLIEMAAMQKHLAVIQYLREAGCPWDASACTAAAGYHSRRIKTADERCATLKWLLDNGCPWNIAEVRKEAAANGIDMLAYVIQHGGVPDAAELTQMLNAAGAFGKLEAVKWLRQQGADWPAVLQYQYLFCNAPLVQAWSVSTLKWARSEGCTSAAL
jgi:hypothetical protein